MEEGLNWLVGAVGVPVIQWMKSQFNLEGRQAVWLTVSVSVILAVAVLLAEEEMALSDFTWANLAAVFGQVLAAATLAYKLLVSNP
jgi:hypothetical protein